MNYESQIIQIMSNRAGYIGGYVGPEMKALFVSKAEEEGVNQTDLLNTVLENHFGEASNYPALSEEELDQFIEDDLVEWDKIGPQVRKELNCFILEAYKQAEEDNTTDIPEVLEILSEILDRQSINPVSYTCEEQEDFQEVLPEELANEIITVTARAVRETTGSGHRKEALFQTIATFLDQRSDTLYVDARRFFMKFSREEWFYLDRLLKEVNDDSNVKFSHLRDMVRYELGEKLEYAASGFFGPKDRGMLELGRKFKKPE